MSSRSAELTELAELNWQNCQKYFRLTTSDYTKYKCKPSGGHIHEQTKAIFYLQFGDYPAACPVAALLQATSIFVSTLSITAIALDRRKLIVYPHEPPPSGKLIMSTVPVIWGSAFAMASPLAIWKTLENWTEFPGDLMNVVR